MAVAVRLFIVYPDQVVVDVSELGVHHEALDGEVQLGAHHAQVVHVIQTEIRRHQTGIGVVDEYVIQLQEVDGQNRADA